MASPASASPIGRIRAEVARLRQALLTPGPEEIAALLPDLESSAAMIRTMDPASATLGELRELQRELRQVARLVESGAEFHQGWAQLLAALAGDYTAAGEVRALPVSATVSIRG